MKCFEMILKSYKKNCFVKLTVNMKCFEIELTIEALDNEIKINRKHEMF